MLVFFDTLPTINIDNTDQQCYDENLILFLLSWKYFIWRFPSCLKICFTFKYNLWIGWKIVLMGKMRSEVIDIADYGA